jgi:branched-chain amino acid transport system ATP-binding protein
MRQSSTRTPSGTGSVLSLRDVWSGYRGISILHGIDMEVGNGEIVAVLGRNGVGKTTLMRTIMGAVPVKSGSIEFGGAELSTVPVHARARLGIGYVPQGRHIFPRLTARENLLVSAYANKLDVEERVEGVLGEFPDLRPWLERLGESLSGGEQQLLALARAMLAQPRLLLLDEPSEGLQPSIVDLIAEKIADIRERLGVAVLLVEQNLEFAAQLAERAYIVDVGQVRRELAPGELLEDSALQHEYMGG